MAFAIIDEKWLPPVRVAADTRQGDGLQLGRTAYDGDWACVQILRWNKRHHMPGLEVWVCTHVDVAVGLSAFAPRWYGWWQSCKSPEVLCNPFRSNENPACRRVLGWDSWWQIASAHFYARRTWWAKEVSFHSGHALSFLCLWWQPFGAFTLYGYTRCGPKGFSSQGWSSGDPKRRWQWPVGVLSGSSLVSSSTVHVLTGSFARLILSLFEHCSCLDREFS